MDVEDNLRKVREKSEEQEAGEETSETCAHQRNELSEIRDGFRKIVKDNETGSVMIVRDTAMGSATVAEDNVASSVGQRVR